MLVETQFDRLNEEKSQLEYKIAQIDQRKDLVEIQKSFIAFTEKLFADGQKGIKMIDEYSKLNKSDQRYMLGQIMKAEIIQGSVSRIICLTQTRDGKKDGDLKVIFRLGKEMADSVG